VLTKHAIDALADRIERAYLRRQPYWNPGCSNARVWLAAAQALVSLHRTNPKYPIDPELFVASQSIDSPLGDPWGDLTQKRAVRRYKRRVRQIIQNLRAELVTEVCQVEARVRLGQTLDTVLGSRSRALSPLGRYIAAHRAGRFDLAKRFASQTEEQHLACPLYRFACHRLIPRAAYPVQEISSGARADRGTSLRIPQFSLN
jgi:hypothetical protein